MVCAIDYMHWEKNTCHGDIKLQNILLDQSKMFIKFIDFGYAKHLELDNPLLHRNCGTLTYMAPEIVRRVPYDARAADVWALGICLYSMILGHAPFECEEADDLEDCIVNHKISYPIFM